MSGPDLRPARGRRGAVSVAAAVALLAGTGAAGYLAVMAALQRPVTSVDVHGVLDRLRATPWTDTATLVGGIIVAAIGVLLVIAAVVPPRRREIELLSPEPSTVTGISPAALRRTLEAAAVGVDGISAADARVGSRRIRLEAVTALRHTDGLQDAATSAVTRRLAALGPRRTRALTTHLHRKDS